MNKAFVILLFPFLILNASSCEVFKIPMLFSHFIAHQQIDDNIGVWDFIQMHYLGADIHDNDEEEDMKLPFKKIDHYHQISLDLPAGKINLLTAAFSRIAENQRLSDDMDYSKHSPGNLFRPPIA